ncbi:unnamed protein product, partial [marine sediment metagenome]
MKSHEYNSSDTRIVRCEHCKSLTLVNNATVKTCRDGDDQFHPGHSVGVLSGAKYYCCTYCQEEKQLNTNDINRLPGIIMLKTLLQYEPEWAIRAIQCLVSDDPRVQRIEMDGDHRIRFEAMATKIDDSGRPRQGEIGFGAFHHLMSIVLPLYAPELHDIAVDNRDRQL